MRNRWILLGIFASAMVLASPDAQQVVAASSTASTQILHLGAENSWPPYSDSNGQGISTQLIKAAFAQSGIQLDFQVLPYARVLHDLEVGKIDGGYNVTLQQTTANRFVFGKIPLVVAESYWFFMPGKHPDIKTIDKIPRDFRVGVILDYEYGDNYEKYRHRFKEVRVSQQAQIIKMLRQGRLDAAVMFDKEEEYTLRKMSLPSDLLEKRFLNHRGGVYLAFSRQNPQASKYASILDEGLLRIIASGEYEHINHSSIDIPLDSSGDSVGDKSGDNNLDGEVSTPDN